MPNESPIAPAEYLRILDERNAVFSEWDNVNAAISKIQSDASGISVDGQAPVIGSVPGAGTPVVEVNRASQMMATQLAVARSSEEQAAGLEEKIQAMKNWLRNLIIIILVVAVVFGVIIFSSIK